MKLHLTTWQRLMCVQCLNQQAGHISLIRRALQLLEVLELTPEEQELVGLAQGPDGSLAWRDSERRFPLEIADGELAAFLQRAVSLYQNWPVAQAAQVMDLFAQLGIDHEGGAPSIAGAGA